MMSDDLDKPTELTREDLDAFAKRLLNGDFDIKMRSCFSCGKEYFPNYGHHLMECDECYFARFPKDQVQAFYRSFLE
jgi:hypothetical protein